MSPDHPVTNRARRLVRSAAGATVAAIAIAVGTGSAGGVDASPRVTSTVVADQAAEAVEALERWRTSRQPIDYVRFVHHRDRAADLAEAEVGLGDGELADSWAVVPVAKQEALLNAVSQLGVPYRSLKSEPGVGFDCSGLTIWAFGEAGVDLPRVSRDQIRSADQVDREEAEAGDLVYYPGHVSIYLGAGMMVHSPNSGNHVEITDLPDRSLRFGDAHSAHLDDLAESTSADAVSSDAVRSDVVVAGSLMDRALTVAE